jgi:arginyl-tRNA synthetase
VDAARFLLVGRSHDTTLELDIDVAREQSNKNPVYYVQYAHARICSILRNLPHGGEGPGGEALPAVATGPEERALARALARYPSVLLAATEHRAPHRLNTYLGELAAEFHVFYRNCRVLVDDAAVAAFREGLCRATRDVLAGGLALLGVTAPETM